MALSGPPAVYSLPGPEGACDTNIPPNHWEVIRRTRLDPDPLLCDAERCDAVIEAKPWWAVVGFCLVESSPDLKVVRQWHFPP